MMRDQIVGKVVLYQVDDV